MRASFTLPKEIQQFESRVSMLSQELRRLEDEVVEANQHLEKLENLEADLKLSLFYLRTGPLRNEAMERLTRLLYLASTSMVGLGLAAMWTGFGILGSGLDLSSDAYEHLANALLVVSISIAWGALLQLITLAMLGWDLLAARWRKVKQTAAMLSIERPGTLALIRAIVVLFQFGFIIALFVHGGQFIHDVLTTLASTEAA